MALTAWGASVVACGKRRDRRRDDSSSAGDPEPPEPAESLGANELAVLDAVVARILPALPDFAGAREARVARFIDRQLRTPQLAPLLPAVMAGLGVLDELARRRHQRGLADLEPTAVDPLLEGLARGTLPVARLPQAALFRALHELTLEGFLSDPSHGGNAEMVGWKAIGFPTPARRPGGPAGGHEHH